MKIAFIHNLPSGGGKRSAFQFIQGMLKKHTVDLFYIDQTSEDYLDLRSLVNRVIFVPGPTSKGGLGIFTSLIAARKAYAEVARQINEGGYDLAFVMQCKICNSPFVLNYLKIPSLYYCAEPLAKCLEFHFWGKGWLTYFKIIAFKWRVLIDRNNARHATLICTNSLYSVENIYRFYGIYPRFCRLGIDINHFHPVGLKREPIVLSVGFLSPAKGQDFLIESVGTLRERPAICFIYNGDHKNYKSHLQKLAAKCGVSISFNQLVQDDDLVKAYNSSAIVAYPSRLEPFGFVPLEAMACGTPVVGVAEAGIRETVKHGENGLLTERDPVEFGKAIQTLMNDESLRKIMGDNGRQYVTANWTLDQSHADLEKNVYRAVRSGSCIP